MGRQDRGLQGRAADAGRALAAALALVALVAACADDPEPLDTLVLTPALTGEDLTERLSEAETACLRTALGDADFAAFQRGPFVQAVDEAYARPIVPRGLMNTIFTCLTDENVPALGPSVMAAHGRWLEDTAACVRNVAGRHPEVVYVWLGLEREPDPVTVAHAAAIHSYLTHIWGCFTDTEKVQFTLHTFATGEGATGQELVEQILHPRELDCLGERMPESSLAMLAGVPSMPEALAIPGAAAAAAACVDADINSRLFVEGYAKRTGGLSEESAACVYQYSMVHPHYMELAQSQDLDISTMSAAELAEIANDSRRLFDCLTNEELARFQSSFAERWY